jgi:putative endonuclease
VTEKQPATYILANKKKGVLYAGVTSNLVKRIWEHKQHLADGFTKKYHLHKLVYFELHEDMLEAVVREKQIKKWRRDWKVGLIERENPEWRDLYNDII